MERNRDLPRQDIPIDSLRIRLEKTFPADVAHIETAVADIMKAIADLQCGGNKEFEIELSLREALANAILHGCKGDPGKEVAVSVACAESFGVLLVVRDPGEGFDPVEIPNPVVGKNVYSNHGRGIFLINQLMDEVRFEKGGTEIHMLKRH